MRAPPPKCFWSTGVAIATARSRSLNARAGSLPSDTGGEAEGTPPRTSCGTTEPGAAHRGRPERRRPRVDHSYYRTIWLDIHLGTRDCKARALLDFLDSHDCDYLYLVGDIIDFWRLKRAPFWPQLHSDVLRKILSKARAGTAVTFIPGNHDEYVRRFCDLQLGNILVCQEAVHRTADGRSLLVLHGDEFDGITRCHRWLALSGDLGYQSLLLVLNRWFNRVRRGLGFGYWSLSAYVKGRIKRRGQLPHRL